MPARSNDFQCIVRYIYEQISDGATVTESGMLIEGVTGRRAKSTSSSNGNSQKLPSRWRWSAGTIPASRALSGLMR